MCGGGGGGGRGSGAETAGGRTADAARPAAPARAPSGIVWGARAAPGRAPSASVGAEPQTRPAGSAGATGARIALTVALIPRNNAERRLAVSLYIYHGPVARGKTI